MIPRLLTKPLEIQQSFFLFGPRGTGKTTWLKTNLPEALYLDLLDSGIYADLLARPERLRDLIPARWEGWVIIDEVQRVPMLLNEAHRLIEDSGARFALTGSSARSLRRRGVNLLAGRALTFRMHPLTRRELAADFDLGRSLSRGHLPAAYQSPDARLFLQSYVQSYLREEVMQEGLTRNIGAFSRFLESASFSQGSILNVSEVARDCAVERKSVQGYFEILQDLLLAVLLPAFRRRAKRRTVSHPKFYFFDAGVYRAIRPTGPLDRPEEIEGICLESLLFQELRALNDYLDLGYELSYWRTATGAEVDFVLYGPLGILALQVTRARRVEAVDIAALRLFKSDYEIARCAVIYGGERREHRGDIDLIPLDQALSDLETLLRLQPPA